MSDFSLTTIIGVIWKAMSGGFGGVNFVATFSTIAGIVWAFMCFVMFASEALDVAAGRGFKLDKKLFVYAFLGLMIFSWPQIAEKSYLGASSMAASFMGDADSALDNFLGAYQAMQQVDENKLREMGMWDRIEGLMSQLPNMIASGFMHVIGLLILLICYVLILIMVAGMFATFAMNLVLGPVFLAFGLSEQFRQYTWRWFGAYMTYFLAIPLFGAALQAAMAIYGSSILNLTNLQGSVTMDHMFITLLGPLVSLGVIFAVNKVVSSLTGGVMGSTGSLAMSMGMAAAGFAAKGIGGAKGAGGAVAGAAGGAAKSGASSSIKAATE